MNPIIKDINEDEFNELSFTIENTNVSIANAIRRTLLSDIQLLVFKTFPHDKNKFNFIKNTTRFNNEIIKQRLSAIPIYIKDVQDFPIDNYEFIINKSNNTDTIEFVTTEDFIIKDIKNNKLLDKSQISNILPSNSITNSYIDIVRLRPRLSENTKGEELNIVGKLSIGTSKEDSNFNAVSTATYSFTPDNIEINNVWEKEIYPSLKEKKNSDEEINEYKKNWLLLEAKKYYIKDSFNFKIKSTCVYNNIELLNKTCDILIQKINDYISIINNGEINIEPSINTIDNCYDIILKNTCYTIGKLLEYFIYNNYYENTNKLSFCGFKKEHPHDEDSILRVAFNQKINEDEILQMLKQICNLSIDTFKKIKIQFK